MDCVRFVSAVWDELFADGQTTVLPRLNQMSGLHGHAWGAMGQTLRAFADQRPLRFVQPRPIGDPGAELVLEPGDLLGCKIGRDGGPGHVMVVANGLNRVYHAAVGRGVMFRQCPSADEIFHVWRARGRSAWVR